MTANRELAELRGIDEATIDRIDSLHTYLETMMDKYIELGFTQARKDEIHIIEYLLQECWGFPKDCGYHTWAPLYEFKCKWYNRTFRCTKTGVQVILNKDMIHPKRFITVGEGAIDLGNGNYFRVVGPIEEILVD